MYYGVDSNAKPQKSLCCACFETTNDVLWFIFGGWYISLMYFLGAISMLTTIVGIPCGLVHDAMHLFNFLFLNEFFFDAVFKLLNVRAQSSTCIELTLYVFLIHSCCFSTSRMCCSMLFCCSQVFFSLLVSQLLIIQAHLLAASILLQMFSGLSLLVGIQLLLICFWVLF